MVTATELLTNFSTGDTVDVISCYRQIWATGGSPDSRIKSGLVVWHVDQDYLVVDDPVFNYITLGIEILIAPRWGVAVKIITYDEVLMRGVDVM